MKTRHMSRIVWSAAVAWGLGCSGAPPKPSEQPAQPTRGALEAPFGSFEEAMGAHQQLMGVLETFDLPIGVVLESGPPCSIERVHADGMSHSAHVRYDTSGRVERTMFEGNERPGTLVMTYGEGDAVMSARFCDKGETEQICASKPNHMNATYDASTRSITIKSLHAGGTADVEYDYTLSLDPEDPYTTHGVVEVATIDADGETQRYPEMVALTRWRPGWVWVEGSTSDGAREVTTRNAEGHVVVRRLEAEPNERETYRRDEQGRVVEIIEETYDDGPMLWLDRRVTRLSYDPENPRQLIEVEDADGGRVSLRYVCPPQSTENSP